MANISKNFKEGVDFVEKIEENKNALGSNMPISTLAGMAYGKTVGNLKGVTGALINDGFSGVKDFYTPGGNFSGSRLALTAFGAYSIPATVGRIASGGGIYRDSEGNFDIIGIPFI